MLLAVHVAMSDTAVASLLAGPSRQIWEGSMLAGTHQWCIYVCFVCIVVYVCCDPPRELWLSCIGRRIPADCLSCSRNMRTLYALLSRQQQEVNQTLGEERSKGWLWGRDVRGTSRRGKDTGASCGGERVGLGWYLV